MFFSTLLFSITYFNLSTNILKKYKIIQFIFTMLEMFPSRVYTFLVSSNLNELYSNKYSIFDELIHIYVLYSKHVYFPHLFKIICARVCIYMYETSQKIYNMSYIYSYIYITRVIYFYYYCIYFSDVCMTNE